MGMHTRLSRVGGKVERGPEVLAGEGLGQDARHAETSGQSTVRHVPGHKSPGDEHQRRARVSTAPLIQGCASLLLAGNIYDDSADICRNRRRRVGIHSPHAGVREPISYEISVEAVVLSNQHAFH